MRRDPKLSTAEVADATAEGEAEIAGVTVVAVVAAAVVVEAAIRFLQGCRTILVGAPGIATPPGGTIADAGQAGLGLTSWCAQGRPANGIHGCHGFT